MRLIGEVGADMRVLITEKGTVNDLGELPPVHAVLRIANTERRLSVEEVRDLTSLLVAVGNIADVWNRGRTG